MARIRTRVAALTAAVALALVGCSATDNNEQAQESAKAEPTTVRLGLIGGAPSVSAAHLLEAEENGETSLDYEPLMATAPDEIVAKLVNGELDAATVPPNLAATLYNRTDGEVQIAAVTTLGFIQIVSTDESIKTLDDLRGSTIVASGKAAVPEYTFTHVLEENGLEPGKDVTVNFYPGHDEATSLFASGQATTATLPAPALVNVKKENEDIHVVADLTDEWHKLYPDSLYSQGSLVLSKTFVEENPEAAQTMLEEYKESAEAIDDDIQTTAELTGKFKIMPTPVAKVAIPDSHQVFITGDDLVSGLNPFLEMLFEANPESLGGELPDEDFYYSAP